MFPGSRILLPRSALRELDRLVARETPGAAAARRFADRFELTSAPGLGDDAVLAAALRERAVVVTADRDLQARLRRHGVPVLAPRDRHRLELRPAEPEPRRRPPVASKRSLKRDGRARPRGNG